MFPRVLDPSFTYYYFLPSVSFRFLGIKTSRMSSFDSDFVIIIPPSSLFLSPQRLSRDKTLIRIIRGETRREKEEERKKRKKERKRKRKRRRSRRERKGVVSDAARPARRARRQQDRRTSTSKHPQVCVCEDKTRQDTRPGQDKTP